MPEKKLQIWSQISFKKKGQVTKNKYDYIYKIKQQDMVRTHKVPKHSEKEKINNLVTTSTNLKQGTPSTHHFPKFVSQLNL